MFIDFAWPTCRYPFGSGGNLVRTYIEKVKQRKTKENENENRHTFVPLWAACCASNSALFTADSNSRANKAERLSFDTSSSSFKSINQSWMNHCEVRLKSIILTSHFLRSFVLIIFYCACVNLTHFFAMLLSRLLLLFTIFLAIASINSTSENLDGLDSDQLSIGNYSLLLIH